MTVDAGDHAEMTALLVEEKQWQEKLDKARKAFEVWRERAFKARDAGRMELYEEAEQLALDAKNAGLQAKHELGRIEMEKDVLREGSQKTGSRAAQAQRQAEHSLQEFAQMGVDPMDRILYETAREQAADDELAALKAKMGKGDD